VCQVECLATKGCTHWTWIARNQYCWIKGNGSNPKKRNAYSVKGKVSGSRDSESCDGGKKPPLDKPYEGGLTRSPVADPNGDNWNQERRIDRKACKDSHKYCEFWKEEGECEINPNYMKRECRKSCKICTGSKPLLDKPNGSGLTRSPVADWIGGKRCRTSEDEESCNKRKNCKWNELKNVCKWKGQGKNCSDYTRKRQCKKNKCEWDRKEKECTTKTNTQVGPSSNKPTNTPERKPTSGIRPPTSGNTPVRAPTSGNTPVRAPTSGNTPVRAPTSGIRPPTSGIRPPTSGNTPERKPTSGSAPPANHPPTGSYAQEIFDCHNIVRCMSGQSAVEWDSALESKSVAFSKSHGFKHSSNAERRNPGGGVYGENLAMGAGGKGACLMYWNEGRLYPGGGVTGHFTAMTWSTVKKIGCGGGMVSGCLYDAAPDSPNSWDKTNKVKEGCTGRSQDQCEQDPKINPLGQAAFSLPRDIFCGADYAKRRLNDPAGGLRGQQGMRI